MARTARRRVRKNPDFRLTVNGVPAWGTVGNDGVVTVSFQSGPSHKLSFADSQALLRSRRVRVRPTRWTRNDYARVNGLFSAFKGKPAAPVEQYDLAEYIARAEDLGKAAHWKLIESVDEEPADDEVHFLVHAPAKNGKGKAWYFLDYVTPRAFDMASAYGVPVRYITAADPTRAVALNFQAYRWPEGHWLVTVDTFTGATHFGPAVQQAAANPHRRRLLSPAEQLRADKRLKEARKRRRLTGVTRKRNRLAKGKRAKGNGLMDDTAHYGQEMIADFKGTCAVCLNSIRPGDKVVFRKVTSGGETHGRWVHKRCAKPGKHRYATVHK